MLIEVDFNSDEAIYIQLCNQIILGIAMSDIQEGDSLPSVRQLADTVRVNMHTVNKAYHVLKREGYISLDKRRGAVIAVDVDKLQQLEVMKEQLRIVLARGRCKNISRQEVSRAILYLSVNWSVSLLTGQESMALSRNRQQRRMARRLQLSVPVHPVLPVQEILQRWVTM